MKTKITAFIIFVILLFSLGSITSFAANNELRNEATENYDKALSIAGRHSFHGNCNHATAYQLQAIGVYKNQLDYSGTGSSWHSYFKNVSRTSGGYNVVTISGKNCLYDLIDRYGDEIYNIVYCLGTGGTSGSNHVLYIRAIIDGNVYFCDSFSNSYNHVYYPEGTCTVLSVDDFVSAYRRMNGNPYGCIYFTKGATEHLEGSSVNPDLRNDTKHSDPGTYVTLADINLKKSAEALTTTISVIPENTEIIVTETSGHWGKIQWNNKTGWVNLNLVQPYADVDFNISYILLGAEFPYAHNENMIKWTANVIGSSKNQYFYSFYIYHNNQKIYAGTFNTDNSVFITPEADGEYRATVTVMDNEGNIRMHSGSTFYYNCSLTLNNDYDNDGVITEYDHFIHRIIIKAMETITGKNFVSEKMGKDGIMRVASENIFPEIPAEFI